MLLLPAECSNYFRKKVEIHHKSFRSILLISTCHRSLCYLSADYSSSTAATLWCTARVVSADLPSLSLHDSHLL